jgi:UPF0176 protein
MVVIVALYKFVDLPDYFQIKDTLKDFCTEQGIMGTLLLATEGINGTVSGSPEAMQVLKAWFKKDKRFDGLEYKESIAEKSPFYRLKVRLKKEIVTLGVPDINPAIQAGSYIEPSKWNHLITDPEVFVIDTRNNYEIRIGAFQGAINPQTNCFTEFPKVVQQQFDPKVHKKVAMYCTGGIRCEKASAYMLAQGFEQVYHLKGGILKYLETVPAEESLWQGDCFVFDQRVAVNHALDKSDHSMCHGCRTPLSEKDRASEEYELGVSCSHCISSLSEKKIKSLRERQKQITLATARGEKHMGAVRNRD